MERCQSGRMGHPAKVLTAYAVRGFESLPLRHKRPYERVFCFFKLFLMMWYTS